MAKKCAMKTRKTKKQFKVLYICLFLRKANKYI